jgi:hypothetical protein
MIRVFICCIFYNTSSVFCQNLSFENDWKYQFPDSAITKSTLSANLGLGSWYGHSDLYFINLATRFVNKPANQIFKLNGFLLPVPSYSIQAIGASTTRKLSPILACHIGYTFEQHRFDESATIPIFHHLRLDVVYEATNTRFSAGLYHRLANNPAFVMDKKLHGVVEVRYRPGAKFHLTNRVHSPNSFAIPIVETEILHVPSKMWRYAIAFSLPNAYFGFRINWTFAQGWDLDIRSKRHPVLGFAHQVLVHYNQP